MARLCTALAFLIASALPLSAAETAKPLAQGLPHPGSVVSGPDGRVYVTVAGTGAGGGAVLAIADGAAVPFASGLNDPKGIVAWKDALFVADRDRVVRIDKAGKVTPYAEAVAFPEPPQGLTGITVDQKGGLYVIDAGSGQGGWALYHLIAPPQGGAKARQVKKIADAGQLPGLKKPAAVAMVGGGDAGPGLFHLLLLDTTGELHSLRLADKTLTRVAGGFGRGGALVWDWFGRLYVGDGEGGKVVVIPRPGESPVPLASGLQSVAGLGLAPDGRAILVADAKAGTVAALPAGVPGAPVDETPLPIETTVAFPDMQWANWSPEDSRGRPNQFRPLVLTHANDGSHRTFVASQQGIVYVFPNDPKATKSKVFLDISAKVRYDDKANEEGFLGLTFHPDYKRTGEFFAFWTDKKSVHANVLSRFRVRKDDPDQADPDSEEELLRIEHKNWNHDGGTIIFGPDGYLYVVLGDGGGANDPDRNGQNLNVLLAKLLRLDVNHKSDGKPYAVPKDNPFVDRKDARPEIYAYGLRNVWRMAFDRKTGVLWAGDVGQDLYEEINLIRPGGNYGWSVRESLHPFGAQGVGPRPDLIDPIWEYHHDVGKSITGGFVYRGKQFPELDGLYLYADYVSGKVWALRYDEAKKRVVANHPLRDKRLPIMSFGEDENGEAYLLTYSNSGQGIYHLSRVGAAAAGR